MGNWKIIVPESTKNNVSNPSFEENVTDHWDFVQAGAGGSAARSSDRARFGVYSAKIIGSDSGESGLITEAADRISLADGDTVYLSAWAYAVTGATNGLIRIYDTTNTASRATDATVAAGAWELLECSWTNTTGSPASIRVDLVNQSGSNSNDVYFDGAQLEEKTARTTYCDGEQDGCEWNGTKHHSSSARSAAYRGGGQIKDLKDDYRFAVTRATGVGVSALQLPRQPYALIPGSRLQGVRRPERVFTLVCSVIPDASNTTLALRDALVGVLLPDAYPKKGGKHQPVRLRYTGGTVDKWIDAHYEGGLEADYTISAEVNFESVPIRFFCEDPFWYEICESAAALDAGDTATFRNVAGWLKSNGQWDNLGMSTSPASGSGSLEFVEKGPDGKWYVGGDFTDWDGVSGADFIARYDPSSDSWETVGGSSTFGNTVYDIIFAPDGDTVYLGGSFVNAGDANGDYIVIYTISTDTISSLSGGGTGRLEALALGHDGILYMGGQFTNWDGIAAADYIVSWDGAAYVALGSGLDNDVVDMDVAPDGTIWIVGVFTASGGTTLNRIATWDGSAFGQVNGSTGLNATAKAVVVAKNGFVYVGGGFTNAGGDANADYVAIYNGNTFYALGSSPPDDVVHNLILGPDGTLYASGNFTEVGGIAVITGRVARWDGSAWAALDLSLAVSGRAMGIGVSDAVVQENYDLVVGFVGQGAGDYAGKTTVTNEGNGPAYPVLSVERSGVGTATLVSMRNVTAGGEIRFNYSLLDGERLTVDLRARRRDIQSSLRGQVWRAALTGHDIGAFSLLKGDNDITLFVSGGTVEAGLVWRDTYDGFEA